MNNAKVIMFRLITLPPPFWTYLWQPETPSRQLALSRRILAVPRRPYELIHCRRSTAIGRTSQIVS